MSLFGGFGAAASQPSSLNQTQSAPSLFGAPQQAQSTSLFGAPTPTPTNSTSLFGSTAPASSPFGVSTATPQASSSLFGAPPPSSASLFGAPASSASLFGAPASSSSLFGAASSGSLFAASAASSSLFATPAGQSSSLFGTASSGSLFAPSQIPQQLQLPNVQPPPPVEVPGHTKINQLPEKYRTDLFAVERHLRDERSKFQTLLSKRHQLEDSLRDGENHTEILYRTVVKLRAEIDAMRTNANSLRAAVSLERSSAEPVVIALENLTKSTGSASFTDSNGLRYGAMDGRLQRASHVPEEYFRRIFDELESRAHTYKSEIDEIAQFLRAQGVPLGTPATAFGKSRPVQRMHGALLLDNISQRYSTLGIHGQWKRGGNGEQVELSGKTIEEVIKRQYEYFMVVASHIANVNEELRSAREAFLQVMRARDGDALNPFEQADLREKADKHRLRILAERNAAGDAHMGIADGTASVPGGIVAQPATAAAVTSVPAGPTGGNLVLTSGALSAPAKDAETGRASLGGDVGGYTLTNSGADGGTSRRMSAGRRKRM